MQGMCYVILSKKKAGLTSCFLAYFLTLNTLVSISSIKHQLVMDDWNRLAPTKRVNHNQLILIYMASNTLMIMNKPAMALMSLFNMVLFFN